MKNIKKKMFVTLVTVLFISTVHAGQKINQTINLGGSHSASWYLPDNTPSG